MSEKEYLGDAVWVRFDGYSLVLTTEDGISETNTIYMEPEVVAAFENYLGRFRAAREGAA